MSSVNDQFKQVINTRKVAIKAKKIMREQAMKEKMEKELLMEAKRNTVMCKFAERGEKCPRQPGTCFFAHSKEELVVPNCRYGIECRYKDKGCRFAHPKEVKITEKEDKVDINVCNFPSLTATISTTEKRKEENIIKPKPIMVEKIPRRRIIKPPTIKTEPEKVTTPVKTKKIIKHTVRSLRRNDDLEIKIPRSLGFAALESMFEESMRNHDRSFTIIFED